MRDSLRYTVGDRGLLGLYSGNRKTEIKIIDFQIREHALVREPRPSSPFPPLHYFPPTHPTHTPSASA